MRAGRNLAVDGQLAAGDSVVRIGQGDRPLRRTGIAGGVWDEYQGVDLSTGTERGGNLAPEELDRMKPAGGDLVGGVDDAVDGEYPRITLFERPLSRHRPEFIATDRGVAVITDLGPAGYKALAKLGVRARSEIT